MRVCDQENQTTGVLNLVEEKKYPTSWEFYCIGVSASQADNGCC